MDPGMQIDNAVQTRRGNRFFLQPPRTDKSYQLVAVAEQGGLQDSRPFEIIDARNSGRLQYQTGSDNNVSPFFFHWSQSLGSLTASLHVDTLTDAYYYRNQPGLATTPGSASLRDLPRTIYRQIPGDIGNSGLPQLKNSLDDFVHMAFFERDVTTRTEFLTDLDSLSYSMTLRAGDTGLDHPFNYLSVDRSTGNLKARTGSRIVTSIHWSEDRDRNGVSEIYLIEINIGGVSSNPSWQSSEDCVSDGNSHAGLITGQYLILGGQAILAGQGLPLRAGETRNLTVDWARILRQLKNREPGSGCRLNATLDHLPNTLALGVAIETRGGVQQALEIAAATAHHQETIPSSLVVQELLQVSDETLGNEDETVVLTQSAETIEVIEDYSPPLSLPTIDVVVVNTVDNSTTSVNPEASTANGSVNSETPANVTGESPATTEASDAEPYIAGSEIRLPVSSGLRNSGVDGLTWWQILSAADWSSMCVDINSSNPEPGDEDGRINELSCEVGPGLYSAIEHISGNRWDNLLVLTGNVVTGLAGELEGLAGELRFDRSERVLSWARPGWYQVQRMPDQQSVCESADSCVLLPGVYQVINHSSGQRWQSILIPQ